MWLTVVRNNMFFMVSSQVVLFPDNARWLSALYNLGAEVAFRLRPYCRATTLSSVFSLQMLCPCTHSGTCIQFGRTGEMVNCTFLSNAIFLKCISQ